MKSSTAATAVGEGSPRLLTGLVVLFALAAIGFGVWQLEAATAGLAVERTRAGDVPVTVYRPASKTKAPIVIIAHGFTGSRQLMQGFGLSLARNGYIAVTFDFPGHGGNPEPFLRRIADQSARVPLLLGALEAVADYAVGLDGFDGRLALVGHSMAGDVLVRYAAAHQNLVGATVLLSPYLAEDAPIAKPRNLQIVYGTLEPDMLHESGRKAVGARISETVEAGEAYGSFDDGSARRLLLMEGTEHIGILFDTASQAAVLDWLDESFDRQGKGVSGARGPALGVLFLGVLALAWPLSRLLPVCATGPVGAGLGWRRLLAAALAPALLTPLLLRVLPTDYLPILRGDTLALHFGIYGTLTVLALMLLARGKAPRSISGTDVSVEWFGLALASLAAGLYATLAFAIPLDRYVNAFWPHGDRAWLIAAMLPFTLIYFLADGWLTRGPGAPRLAPAATKAFFLLSLILAIALNLRELFFLAIIFPAILVFLLVYQLLGGWIYKRTRHPFPGALAAALAFAWAIAVTFPLVRN